jgi:hypothetical protein
MNSIHRSVLARSLMTGVASLAFMMMGAAGVRAEIVNVQGDDGAAGADGVNPGDNGVPGGDGESVTANAGSAQPITAPLNKATATGGNGGRGGNGAEIGDNASGGNGGHGGAATATAATTIISGSAEADANSHAGNGGAGGGAAPRRSMEMTATEAMAVARPRRAPQRTHTAVPSPATRPRKVAREVTRKLTREETPILARPMEARAVTRTRAAMQRPAARGT